MDCPLLRQRFCTSTTDVAFGVCDILQNVENEKKIEISA